jgi:vitamin B12 transporter
MNKITHLTIPILLCSSAHVFGAQTPFSANSDLESITVTASHTPVSIRDTASAITIITKDEIQRRNVSNISDLLRNVPGFSVNQQGSRGAITQLRVRGSEANHVLVLIDGVRANDIAQGGQFNFAHLMSQGIEQIEIIRGPQSALWGADALAGVVNVITTRNNNLGRSENSTQERAQEKVFNANIELGSFDSNQWGLNIANGRGDSQFKVGLNGVNTDGTNISRQGDETDGYKNTTVSLSGSTIFADFASVGLSYRQTNSETEFDDTDFFTTGLPTDADSKTDSEQKYLSANLGFTLLDGRVSQKFIATRTETDNENYTSSPVNDVTKGQMSSLRTQTDIFLSAHTVSLIAELEKEDFTQRGDDTFGDPNRDEKIDTVSVASEYRFNGEKIDISAGARLDNNSDFDNAISWRITAAWHAGEKTTLFGSMGEANTNPTFSERFGFFTNFQGNPDLKPEHSFSWELGLRTQVMENIQLSGSWFNATLDDEINGFVFDPITSQFTAANQQGESNREGLELSLTWQVSDNLDLQANYTWLDATEDLNAGGQREEVRRPSNIGSINANYNMGLSNLNLNVSYNGEQLDDFFPPFPTPREVVTLDAYTLVTLSYLYQINDTVQLNARLENLLDENYEEVFGYSAPGFGGHLGVNVSF